MSWRTRWRLYEYVRNSIWIVPGLFGALAIVAGIVLPDVDESVDTTIGIEFGQDAARSVLGSLAGGMITFTGFVFSILLLAVQFGSSQFSPRLLRRFLRDPTTKVALGVFMATFLYALMVLRVVGTADDDAFVPNNAVSVAMLLLLASMLMFLRLIHRTTQGLRVATVLGELGADARRVVDRVYPEPLAEAATGPEPSEPDAAEPDARVVPYAGEPGIVQSIDKDGLVELARGAGAVDRRPPPAGVRRGGRRAHDAPGRRVRLQGARRRLGARAVARRERPDERDAGARPDRAAAAPAGHQAVDARRGARSRGRGAAALPDADLG
jgi:uncharacterized membrane protein